jgi:hypothetical protein
MSTHIRNLMVFLFFGLTDDCTDILDRHVFTERQACTSLLDSKHKTP